MRSITRKVAALVAVLGFVVGLSGIAGADKVQTIVAEGATTFAQGSTTTISYYIQAQEGTCDAADGSAATVNIVTPTGVTANPTSLTFTVCHVGNNKNEQPVVFSSNTPGTYNVTVNVTDSAGSYAVNDGAVSLTVTSSGNACDAVATPSAPTIVATPGTPDGTSPWYTSTPTVVATPAPGTTIEWATQVGAGVKSAFSSTVPTLTDGTTIVYARAVTTTCSKTSPESNVTLNVDTVNPSIDITSPAGPSTTAASVTVSGTQSDATSGVAGVTVNGSTATLGTGTFSRSSVLLSCGANTITAVATDAAGRTGSDILELYRVCYTATFGQPLDANGVINKAKLGRVLPVKVEIASNNGSAVPSTIYLGYYKTPCTTGAATDPVEEYVAAGSSNAGNTFRPADVGWIYNLDTNKLPNATVGNCYQLDIYVGGIVNNDFATGGVAAINGIVKIQLLK